MYIDWLFAELYKSKKLESKEQLKYFEKELIGLETWLNVAAFRGQGFRDKLQKQFL